MSRTTREEHVMTETMRAAFTSIPELPKAQDHYALCPPFTTNGQNTHTRAALAAFGPDPRKEES